MGDNVRQIPGLHLSNTTVVVPDLYVRQRSQRSRNEIGKQPIKQETNFGDKAVAETEQLPPFSMLLDYVVLFIDLSANC